MLNLINDVLECINALYNTVSIYDAIVFKC